jgi:transcriptional regulator with GAF, ATPase, and Fis domain
VDLEIETAQERVCRVLGVDRCSLWQYSPEHESLILSHLWEVSNERVPPGLVARQLFPWINGRLLDGESITLRDLDDFPAEASTDRESFRRFGITSNASIPLSVGGRVFGALAFGMKRGPHHWSDQQIAYLRMIAQVFANALDRKKSDEDLRQSLEQVHRLKDRLQAESEYLRGEVRLTYTNADIVGESASIKSVLRQIEQVSSTDSTVLITGETGTGKELVARAIHANSRRRDKILVKVDCASLPSGLIESELFGRERGAYTGAMTRQLGRFQIADASTIFLDEIGELPLELQGKLLRVLDEGEFEPLGGSKTVKVDARVIAATNRDLSAMAKEGRFREDLLFRLRVFPIEVPPLRDRKEDIPLLVWSYVRRFSADMGKNIRSVPRDTMEAFQAYSWPGNVRELKNLIEQAFILTSGDRLQVRLSSLNSGNGSMQPRTLERAEREHILDTLRRTAWRIKGPGGAAGELGLKPSTLYAKMKKLRIPVARDRDRITT